MHSDANLISFGACDQMPSYFLRPEPQAETPFLQTEFCRHYSYEKRADTCHDALAAIHNYLEAFYRHIGVPGAPNAEQDSKELQQEIMKDQPQDLKPGAVIVRAWTSTRLHKPFYALVQQGLIRDAPKIMEELVVIVATMNTFSVNRQRRRSDELAEVPEQIVLYRGGRLPSQHVAWFEQARDSGIIFRVRTVLPTSSNQEEARTFMYNSTPGGEPFVLWRYHNAEKCRHVNSFREVSLIPREEEFAFVPYSAFICTGVCKKEVRGKWEYYEVDLKVLHDNLLESHGGVVPDTAPIAPWA